MRRETPRRAARALVEPFARVRRNFICALADFGAGRVTVARSARVRASRILPCLGAVCCCSWSVMSEVHPGLAEVLEERYARGSPPAPATLAYIRAVLDQIRLTGQLLPFDEDIVAEGIDIQVERNPRTPYTPRLMPEHASLGLWSSWSGPHNTFGHQPALQPFGPYSRSRLLHHGVLLGLVRPQPDPPARQSFETLFHRVLAVDNKNTWCVPGLVMSYASEDPVPPGDPHLPAPGRPHLQSPRRPPHRPPLLTANIHAHCCHFADSTSSRSHRSTHCASPSSTTPPATAPCS